jgi:hypothetical protein
MDGAHGGDLMRAGNDRLWGDSGNDTLHGDWIVGGNVGDDTAVLGSDELRGGADSDRLWGDTVETSENVLEGNDQLFGEDGDDDLNGEWGVDRHSCGNGWDWADGGPGLDSEFECEVITNIP